MSKKLEEITAEESQITNQLETRQAQLKQVEEDFALAHDQVKYPIHTEPIDDAFKEANIEISFPQRDGHLDQIGLLSVRVLEKQGKKN